MWLLLAFIAVPLIEIALFINVGGLIGLWPTLLIVLLTAILGANLVKREGAKELLRLRQSFNDLRDPSENLAGGAMILFSGALLLTPGFFTDAVGFALLIPAVRTSVYKYLRGKVKVQSFTYGQTMQREPRDPQRGDTIDGDFVEVDPEKRPTHPSGWTRH
ncbi:FxsA family protein [Marivivens aquimaris]|uniref:FxsA family protein n=1 Tax=Marivivens aquimaris TaxID=2774876 RepID=UPI00188172E5|nr:FxsA family protein [Marivivens aquimaris]